MSDRTYTVGELVDMLSKYDRSLLLRVLDPKGFKLSGVDKVEMVDGRVTIMVDWN